MRSWANYLSPHVLSGKVGMVMTVPAGSSRGIVHAGAQRTCPLSSMKFGLAVGGGVPVASDAPGLPGRPRPYPSPITVFPKLLPNQQNQLRLHLLQVGAHGPRGVQQDAHLPLQNGTEQPAAPCSAAEGGRGGQAVRGGPSWGLFRAAGCHMCGLARPPPAGSAAGDGLRDAVGGGGEPAVWALGFGEPRFRRGSPKRSHTP